MIPLCLITGFLGSGKTTLLRNLADTHAGRGLAFLVNDFGSIDVDGALMQEADHRVVSVAGGSIFCKCLVTEFISVLGSLPGEFDPSGVVIEASGIADPRVIRKMLEETGLDQTYDLRTVVTVVDPDRLLKLLHTLPNIRHQIEAADVVLINKVDLYPSDTIEAAETEIGKISPGAHMRRCVRCQIALDPFADGGGERGDGDYALCADPNYARFTVPGDRISVDALRAGIGRLGDDIYRIKGFIGGGTGILYVDYSGGEIQTRPAVGDPEQGLVIIARGSAEHRVRSWIQGLTGSLPKTPIRNPFDFMFRKQ